MPRLDLFTTKNGVPVPAVSALEMQQIDALATDVYGLQMLQMMENAGRTLAAEALQMLTSREDSIVVLAGAGGNGGGGLCAARHLIKHGIKVTVALARSPEELQPATQAQWQVLSQSGIREASRCELRTALSSSALVIDAIVGYGLDRHLRGREAEMAILTASRRVLSLDIPSGMHATTGETDRPCVRPERILTLALPKIGLAWTDSKLMLANLGIPTDVYRRAGIDWQWPVTSPILEIVLSEQR